MSLKLFRQRKSNFSFLKRNLKKKKTENQDKIKTILRLLKNILIHLPIKLTLTEDHILSFKNDPYPQKRFQTKRRKTRSRQLKRKISLRKGCRNDKIHRKKPIMIFRQNETVLNLIKYHLDYKNCDLRFQILKKTRFLKIKSKGKLIKTYMKLRKSKLIEILLIFRIKKILTKRNKNST